MLQGLTGLPEHGVLLTGTLDHPVLVNLTNRAILGHLIFWNPGGPETTMAFRTKARSGRTMLAAGGQLEVAPADDQNVVVATPNGRPVNNGSPRQSAMRGAVDFEDGEVVGPYAQPVIDMTDPILQAERDIHQKLLTNHDWDEIQRAANRDRRGGPENPLSLANRKLMRSSC